MLVDSSLNGRATQDVVVRTGSPDRFADLTTSATGPDYTPKQTANVRASVAGHGAVTVCHTLIESHSGPLTKTFGVDENGRITKSGDTKPYRGTARRIETTGTATDILSAFRDELKGMETNQAIICAPPPAGKDDWLVVTKGDLDDNPQAIARTKEHFRPVEGPALLGLDFDTAAFPQTLRDKLREANISQALASVCPSFSGAASLRRASSSAGVALHGQQARHSGQHRYYVASDGARIHEFVRNLADRLMLAGFIWGFITETGRIDPRTLFDVQASQETYRLFYEADPVINGDRLRRVARDAELAPGGVLDVVSLGPLSEDERERLAATKAELVTSLAPEAAKARSAYEKRHVPELAKKRGISEEAARKLITGAVDKRELCGDFEVVLDDGEVVTITEILEHRERWHNVSCRDPLEPDYGAGKAKIYSDQDAPCINSFAHGGATYRLARSPDEFFEELSDEVPKAAIATISDDQKERDVSTRSAGPAGDAVGGNWPEPLDIFGDESPLELATPPAGSLPDVIDRLSRSEARRKGVSQVFAAASMVTVCAAAIGSSLAIRPRLHDDGWTEPAGLWTVLVAEPGRAKSPTIAAAVKPLRDLDAKRWKVDKVAHDAWLARAKSKKKGSHASEGALDPEPKVRRFIVDNATLEKQGSIHAVNPRGLLRVPDELVSLLGSLGAYKAGPDADRGQMLSLFDGGELLIDRVTSGTTRAESALMSVIASSQPEKVARLTRDLGGDGMLQRFLWLVDDGAERQGIDEEPDHFARQEYDALVGGLAEAEYGREKTVRLSREAYNVLEEARGHISALANVPGSSTAWRGHVEKWGKLLPRLTLVFHCIDHWSLFESVDPAAEVDVSTARKTVLFARFLLRHALRFYETYFGTTKEASEARWLAGFILTRPELTELTRRTVYDARTDLRGDTRKLLLVMGELENVGWVSVTARDDEGPKRWAVNPNVHSRFSRRGEWEKVERERRRQLIKRAGESRKSWLGQDTMSVAGDE